LRQKPTVAALRQKPTVAALRQKPTVAALRQKPTVAALRQKPTVAATGFLSSTLCLKKMSFSIHCSRNTNKNPAQKTLHIAETQICTAA
ncbi:MAG: hypothetical protein J5604_00690, partial [Bacteroidales bacterium]|nr:hypothetical protein [Bacteroidales bacterium]